MKNLIIILALFLSTISFGQKKTCAEAIIAWNSIGTSLDAKTITQDEASHMFNSLRENYGKCVPRKKVITEPVMDKPKTVSQDIETDDLSLFLSKFETYRKLKSPISMAVLAGTGNEVSFIKMMKLKRELLALYRSIELESPGKLEFSKRTLRIRG